MGCCCTKEDTEPFAYNRRVTTNIYDGILREPTTPSYQNLTRPRQQETLQTELRSPRNTTTVNTAVDKPLHGKYKCNNCGRFWSSRLCWPGKYQLCKRCKKPVYPHTTRELLPSDHSDDVENKEHEKELCEMCKSLGYYCNSKKRFFYKNTLYS